MRRGIKEYAQHSRWRKQQYVVDLDFVLIHRAKRLIDGANVHLAYELIVGYEFAVSLHNSGSRPHVQYQEQYEKQLRKFVSDGGQQAA
jgi:hypothetical protein